MDAPSHRPGARHLVDCTFRAIVAAGRCAPTARHVETKVQARPSRPKRTPALDVVIDSNCLRTDALRRFLSTSPRHRAVLVDHASIEAYKREPLITIGKSMAILGEYPRQVLVLRSTGTIAKLDSRPPAFSSRMVWKRYTRTFPMFAASLPAIDVGEPTMSAGATWLGDRARELMDRRRALALALPAIFQDEVKAFGTDQLKRLRERVHPDGATLALIRQAALNAMVGLHGPDARRDAYGDKPLLNHFAFRHGLCMATAMLQWVRDGRSMTATSERLENDAIDIVFATYGSYFNGLMTNDRRAANLHADLRALLLRMSDDRPARLILPTDFASEQPWTEFAAPNAWTA